MFNRIMLTGLAAALALIASACQLDVERNADGSLQIEAIVAEADIAEEIALGISDDPEAESVTVDLKDGYALVEMVGKNDFGTRTETVSFRLELFVVDAHLGAEVSDAVWNDIEIPSEMVEMWNEELAWELEQSAKDDPDSTLAGVSITEDQLRFEFRVETPRSKGERSRSGTG
jgi:hypothetical protein